jgi:hypothetical protein
MRRRSVALTGLAAACVLASACPTSHGFQGQIYEPGAGGLHLIANASTNQIQSDTLVPVPSARVECTGCARPIVVDAQGRFFVGLGTGARATPIVLRVTAPGFAPLEVEVVERPSESQLGYGSMVIVLKPDNPADRSR